MTIPVIASDKKIVNWTENAIIIGNGNPTECRGLNFRIDLFYYASVDECN